MFRRDKKLFVTIILMLIIVASLITITWLYENRNRQNENVIEAKDKSLNSITISYGELEKTNTELVIKNKELEEKNKELEEKLQLVPSNVDMTKYMQSLNDLSDISNMIKQGNISGAKEELLKIDPMGFDPAVLSFYESLCRELNITKEN